MPFRPQQLDTGFSSYLPPAPEPTRGPVTTRESIGALFTGDTETLSRATQETVATLGAAFRMENDIVNTVDLLTRPSYEPDPSFDVAARLKADGLWNDYSQNFVGVRSEGEYLDISARIMREEQDRAVLSTAGLPGVIAQMTAGLVSPTVLLPFVGAARGGRAIAIGLGAGLAGGAAQELPLQLAQETRTLEESVSSVALSTVVGGVLGGAVAFARRTPQDIADTIEANMAVSPRDTSVSGTSRPTSAGAAVARQEAPQLASAMGLEDTVGQISPVVRQLTSRYDQARWMMAQLADAGLEFAQGRVGAVGGNVENRIKTYYGPVDTVMRGLDDAFARYQLEGNANKPFAVQRANLAGLNPNRAKLSRSEFKEAIGRAMQQGDKHEIPEVAEMAAMIRREIYDPIYKRAQAEGIYKVLEDGVTETPGDVSYLNRVYNQEMIEARQDEFEAILASHYEQKLVDQFRKAWEGFSGSEARLAERVEDFRRPPEEIKALREDFEQQLRALEEGRDEELAQLEDTISDLRSAARAAGRGAPERASLLDEARSLESQGGEALAQTRATRSEIRRRLKNLRQAEANLSARHQAKLDKIDRAEELSFNTLQRLVRRGQKVLNDLDKVSDEKLEAELSKLRNQFAEAAARYDRNELRIAQVFDDEFEADVPTSPFAQAAKVETQTFDKMTDLAEAIEQVDVYDRAMARTMIQAGLDDAIMRAQSIVERRAVRNARLADQAEKLDPAAAAKRIDDLVARQGLKRQDFLDQWRERGANDIDPVTGQANFKQFAAEMARTTTNKILGTHMRLPGMDIILEPRGAELARVLDIDSRALVSADGRSFLELDSEKLMMMYVRTLAPDIELHRVLGDFAPDFGRNEQFIKLDEEVNAYRTRVQEDMKNGINPDTGKPKTYTQEQIDKRGQEIADEYRRTRRDLEAVIGRLRHTWGVPKDPRGFGARAAKVAANVNTLRFMNMVTVSSIPDVARPIQKYGLLRTFRDGWVPFIKGLGNMQLTTRQLRQAGAALDVTLHSRSAQIYDIGDYMVRGSKFEKGLEYTTSKIGLVALFDYWTTAMKQITGSVANAQASDALSVVAGGAKANKKDLAAATRFLAANGIDDEMALRIWRQFEQGGGEQVNGQWWPNTEDWTDPEAVTAYNAMLVREVDNAIITPGVERPLMADANPVNRLLFQFKSFGMSSTTKTFLAGAQSMRQGDMAFVTGGLISLALGALSYYIAAEIAGGTMRDRMRSALEKGEWEKFTDEAINRSGLLGIGADIQSAFLATPLAPYISFSGERSTRRGGDNLYETLLGPTFGDLGPRSANVVAGTGGALESLLSTGEPALGEIPWSDIRRMMPFQNHFLLRQFYDMIEEGAGALPTRSE